MVMKLTEPDPDARFSADQALRDPWLSDSYNRMDFLLPSVVKGEDKSPDAGGSFAVFKNVTDKREMGAEIVFGNLE
jgi:hypothetical protein